MRDVDLGFREGAAVHALFKDCRRVADGVGNVLHRVVGKATAHCVEEGDALD